MDNGALAVIVEDKNFENTAKIFLCKIYSRIFTGFSKTSQSTVEHSIIALTGSNGKLRPRKSFMLFFRRNTIPNILLGISIITLSVPLTILSIKPEHEMAVVEMGANHQKEIEFLCTIAQPNFGYITNFGKAHLEGFGGVEGVIKGKSELYDYLKSNNQFVVVNENDPIQVEKNRRI